MKVAKAGVGVIVGECRVVQGEAGVDNRGVAVVGVVGGRRRAVQFVTLYVRRGVTCVGSIVGECWAVPGGTRVGCRGY